MPTVRKSCCYSIKEYQQGSSGEKIWGGSVINVWVYVPCHIPWDTNVEENFF